MSVYARIRRQQAIRQAEGYLDLLMVFAGQWSPAQETRNCLAQRALECLHRVELGDGDRGHALYLQGQALRVMERYREAVRPLREAARLEPRNIHIHLALGWCYKRTGRLDLAIQSLESALDVDNRQAIIHYNLACYWSLARNAGLALSYLSQAIQLDSEYRDLVADEADFDPVRQHPEFLALTAAAV